MAATHGDYLLTLTGHSGETIYFSDRPEREFGEVKTNQFFQSMGFTPANPPNAALVVDAPDQEDDVLLLELFNAAYDEGTQTLTYGSDIQRGGMGVRNAPDIQPEPTPLMMMGYQSVPLTRLGAPVMLTRVPFEIVAILP